MTQWNLAYRAAVAFFEEIGLSDYGIEISMKKHIPVGAGMGGGSANAAGVLLGLNRLYGAGLSMQRLSEIGLTLGADVPFCLLMGGAALACGIGERLTPLPSMPHCTLVVAKPRASISTPVLYRKYDECGTKTHPDCMALAREMGGSLRRVARPMRKRAGAGGVALGAHDSKDGAGAAAKGRALRRHDGERLGGVRRFFPQRHGTGGNGVDAQGAPRLLCLSGKPGGAACRRGLKAGK